MSQQKYNPFLSPPDFALAERHYRCTLVPHPFEPSIECPCCRQLETFHRPSLFIKTKDLIFLGPEITYLFYFLQVIILLIIFAFLVASSQFFACGMTDEETCKILYVNIQFLNTAISVPAGFINPSTSMEYMNIIVIAAYFVAMFLIEIRLNYRYLELSDRKLSYADFSIMLKNVPTNALKDDVVHLMSELQFDIKSVTLVKKTNILRKMLKYRRDLRKKLSRAMINANKMEINNITYEWASISALIRDYQMNQTETRYRTTQVFVTFKTLGDKKQFLTYYQKRICHKLLFKCCSPCSMTKIKGSHIQFLNAPPPRDIIWKNLQKPYWRSRFRRFISFIFSFMLVIFGACAAFGIKSFSSSVLVGIALGGVMQINNYIIVEFMNYSISAEHYWTHTETKVCQVNRLTFFLFLNITILPFILYMYGILEDRDSNQLWNEMGFSVIFISLSNMAKPFILLFDVGYFMQILKRCKEKYKGGDSILCQFQAHALFQPPEFQIHVIYSLILSSLLSTFFFFSKIPVLMIPQFILLILIILTSRYLLTRRCKKPFQYTRKLSQCVNRIFTLCVPVLYLGLISFKLLEQRSEFMRKYVESIYPGVETGLVVMYLLIINFMDIPRSISKWMIRRQQLAVDRRTVDLNSSMNYSESDPMLRLLDDHVMHQEMEKIPDELDVALLLKSQYDM